MDLKHFVRILFKRKWLILMVVAISALATLLITLRLPKEYKAETRLTTGIYQQQFPGNPNRDYELEAQINRYLDEIRSSEVVNLLSYRLILHDLNQNPPFRNAAQLQDAYSPEELKNANSLFQTKLDSIERLVVPGESSLRHVEILKRMGYDFEALYNNLVIERDRDDDLIRVEFTSENPELSAFVVNSLSEEFIRFHKATLIDRSRNTVGYFTKEVANRKQRLSRSIANTQSTFSSNNNLKQFFEQRELLSNLQAEEESRIRTLERALSNISQTMGTQSSTSSGLGFRSRRILNFREKISGFSRSHVRAVMEGRTSESGWLEDSLVYYRKRIDGEIVRSARESIAKPDSEAEHLRTQKMEKEQALEVARENVRNLESALEPYRSQEAAIAQNTPGWDAAIKKIEDTRKAYIGEVDRLNEARYASMNASSEVALSELAQAPANPVSEQRLVLPGLAALLSLSLCVITLLLLEYMDTTIRSSSQFQRLTDLPILGTVNQLNADQLDLIMLFSEVSKDSSLESYKHLMRKLRFEIISSDAEIFLITSSRAGVGKTSLLFSLAYALSLNHKKVLLIDTAFRDHRLTEMTAAAPTLERYMAGELEFDQLISPSGLDNVDIIGVEGGNYTPFEVLVPSEKFEQLLNQLREKYDYLFMEGPDLNSFAGSKELVEYVDKVIPIFSAKDEIKQPDKQSVQYLNSLGDKLMGAVLNKVDMEDLEE